MKKANKKEDQNRKNHLSGQQPALRDEQTGGPNPEPEFIEDKPIKTPVGDASSEPLKAPAIKADPSSSPAQVEHETYEQREQVDMDKPVWVHSMMSDFDVHLFREGRHFKLYEKMGSHVMELHGQHGTFFAVWAPAAKRVSVVGSFNGWNNQAHELFVRWDGSGIWEGFIPGVGHGEMYKYHIESYHNNYSVDKGDPFAFKWETPPQTASVIWDKTYEWSDHEWMDERKESTHQAKPFSVYEMHLGSWRRKPEEGDRSLSYRELAGQLPHYLNEMGYTHVEFMPIMEHPFYGSWGYQVTGYFAPTSRYGSPQDFMYLVNELHKEGIGVILDWVPSHFPSDEHGLSYFDGSHLFEHQDPREGYHPDWNSYIFNYGRNEVRCFLISNALFWLEAYHTDGLRVDAVASMLYRDYSRKEGEWIPNQYGGRENLEAISFLKQFNEAVHLEFPDVYTVAEESTAWPMVSRPTYVGGLGFDMKWMMGWMHDTLVYFSKEAIYRQYHQNEITFSIIYAFTENYMLPLSHDEVVYGKQSLIYKMPGDEWQKFANLRALYSYMYAHPGGKLLFMGGEFAQTSEWSHERSLDWHLLQFGFHEGIQKTIQRLNGIYKHEKALYEKQFDHQGFEWIDINDSANSVICFLRRSANEEDTIAVVCNFTPIPRYNYNIGVPFGGRWIELFNSDDGELGGSHTKNPWEMEAAHYPSHGKPYTLSITLPPLGVIYMKRQI